MPSFKVSRMSTGKEDVLGYLRSCTVCGTGGTQWASAGYRVPWTSAQAGAAGHIRLPPRKQNRTYHDSVSSLLRTHPPPSRLSTDFPVSRLYGLPCSRDFSLGRGGLLQLLSVSLLPYRRSHPAGGIHRFSQSTGNPVAFELNQRSRPPGFVLLEATCAFTFVTAR